MTGTLALTSISSCPFVSFKILVFHHLNPILHFLYNMYSIYESLQVYQVQGSKFVCFDEALDDTFWRLYIIPTEGSINFLFAKFVPSVSIVCIQHRQTVEAVYIQYFLLQLTGMSLLSLMSRMCRCCPLEENAKEQIWYLANKLPSQATYIALGDTSITLHALKNTWYFKRSSLKRRPSHPLFTPQSPLKFLTG